MEILAKSFQNGYEYEIFSNKIIDHYGSTKYSDAYFLQATYEFSILLFECNNYIKSFDLISDKEIYSYQHLINLLKSNTNDAFKSRIVKKIINSLNSDTNYNIPMNGDEESSEDFMQRGGVLIELANYYIELDDTKSALELANQ